MNARMARLVPLLSLVVAVLFLSGCIVHSRGRSRHHSRRAKHSHGAHQHCHYKGGKHNKRVCHNHPHGDGHH